ncbi:MAG: hypothetical protein ACRCZG_01520, partial [Culicoidibacterales bacterium]
MGDFNILGVLPTVEEVQQRCNVAFDALFYHDKQGVRHPYVCTFCDEFIMCEQEKNFYDIASFRKKTQLFAWSEYLDAQEIQSIQPLVDSYTFNDRDDHLKGDTAWLKGLCLSPRGVIDRKTKKRGQRAKPGFSCCKKCITAIQNDRVPFNAII